MAKLRSLKQRKFIKEYVKSGNATQSAIKSGYSPKTAYSIGSELLSKPVIQSEIKEVLDKTGLTDEYLATGLKTAIDKGLSSDRKTLADGIRSIELVARLKDKFPAERKQIETKSLHLSLKGKSIEELQEQYQELIEDSKQYQKLIEN